MFVQSLLYLPFAIANALTARLNDGYVIFDITISAVLVEMLFSCLWWSWCFLSLELPLFTFYCSVPLVDDSLVLLGYCAFTGMIIILLVQIYGKNMVQCPFSPWRFLVPFLTYFLLRIISKDQQSFDLQLLHWYEFSVYLLISYRVILLSWLLSDISLLPNSVTLSSLCNISHSRNHDSLRNLLLQVRIWYCTTVYYAPLL